MKIFVYSCSERDAWITLRTAEVTEGHWSPIDHVGLYCVKFQVHRKNKIQKKLIHGFLLEIVLQNAIQILISLLLCETGFFSKIIEHKFNYLIVIERDR